MKLFLNGLFSKLKKLTFSKPGDIQKDRRGILSFAAKSFSIASLGSLSSCFPKKETVYPGGEGFNSYLKKNFRLMTDNEKNITVERIRSNFLKKHKQDVNISVEDAKDNTLFGYAFNISKCKGYRDCVKSCVEENNQDRDSNMQYIKIFEFDNGESPMNLGEGDATYTHEVPKENSFYLGTQCFQCEDPPCVPVCPVGATWKEKDGITVIDYDWCIGCRYCEAACPYWARRFNWGEPQVPKEEINKEQHYLGNRMRTKGVMEKCTFCLQRSRKGKNPACVEACPTGARVFGNLLDPKSEISYILKNKKVFRLKEDLGTDPKFWYYMD